MPAILAALVKPLLEFLYFVIKDILRGNAAKKAEKAVGDVIDDSRSTKDKWKDRT